MKRLQAYNLFETKEYPNALKSIMNFFNTTTVTKINALDNEYYGKILSKNSQDSLALEYFNKSLLMDTLKTSLYQDMASSYEKLKKWELACIHYEKLLITKANPVSSDYFYYGRTAYIVAQESKKNSDSIKEKIYLTKADTAFGSVVSISPQVHLGYLWKARVNALEDPNIDSAFAKTWYDQVITILEASPGKSPKDLIESYQYLGSYYYYKVKDKIKSKEYFNKILTIDPNYKQALDALKELK